jgi:outer membrane immunogenic protein
VFGGKLGCDWQVAGFWVLGLQGTFSGADQSQFNSATTPSSTLDWYATITGRLGWAINNVFIYGKGAGAWARHKLEVDNLNQVLGSPEVTPFGWAMGTGVEWAFAPSWSAFIEADYLSFGSTPLNLNAVPGFNPSWPIGEKK